jgi:hypothetical protein
MLYENSCEPLRFAMRSSSFAITSRSNDERSMFDGTKRGLKQPGSRVHGSRRNSPGAASEIARSHGLHPVAYAEALVDRGDVELDGVARDEQTLGDRLVRKPLGEQGEHLDLPRARCVQQRIARTAGGRDPAGGEDGVAGVDAAQRGDHVVRRGALEHHAVDLDVERLPRQPGLDPVGEQHEPARRDRPGGGPQERSHVAVARQVGVDEREVGSERPQAGSSSSARAHRPATSKPAV